MWNGLPCDCFPVNSSTCFKKRLFNIDFSHLLNGNL